MCADIKIGTLQLVDVLFVGKYNCSSASKPYGLSRKQIDRELQAGYGNPEEAHHCEERGCGREIDKLSVKMTQKVGCMHWKGGQSMVLVPAMY